MIESNIDANSEMIRRIEEMEEKYDTIDDMITSRMNQIRDTLMETLLEKQFETNNMIKNVKDNLEVISTAGESVPAPQPTAVAKLTRVNTVSKNIINDAAEPPPMLRGSVNSNPLATLQKQKSYRRPSMSGTVVQGSGIDANEGGVGGSLTTRSASVDDAPVGKPALTRSGTSKAVLSRAPSAKFIPTVSNSSSGEHPMEPSIAPGSHSDHGQHTHHPVPVGVHHVNPAHHHSPAPDLHVSHATIAEDEEVSSFDNENFNKFLQNYENQ
jgi:hypothetical protein